MIGMLLFVSEVIKYSLLYQVLYEKKVKRAWVAPAMGLVYAVLFVVVFRDFDIYGKKVLGHIFAWFAFLFMSQECRGKRASSFLILLLISLGLEQVLSIPLRIVNLFVELESYLGEYVSFVLSVFVLLAVVIMFFWKKRRKKVKKWDVNNRALYGLILIMIFGMLVTVACVDFAEAYVSNFKYSVVTIILCATMYVSIGMLGVFVIRIRAVNARMEELLQNEMTLKEMQKSYYETLLSKEEETRSYRHDMVGHLMCLESFATEQRTEELKAYLKEMRHQMSEIQRKNYVTGNPVLDVITNHFLSCLDKEVQVQVSGFFKEEPEIDDVSLCTIYMNLLRNAIEETERITDAEKLLKIEFLQGECYSQIKIQNSLSEKSRRKADILKSEKEDRRNHGFGIRNVERVVKRCGGSLELQVNKDMFIAGVVLKTKK